MTQPMPGEFELIHWIRSQTASSANKLVRLGIGDDCAILNQPPSPEPGWLVTTDMLLEGRHFQLSNGLHSPHEIGRKALAVNISDIAAMAGTPVAAFISVALPNTNTDHISRELTLGLQHEADRFSIQLAGGDTNVWSGGLVINVTLLGIEPAGGAVLRSGAKPGDIICVTGPLGGSLPSGRHMRVQPQIQKAAQLKSLLGNQLHAMIDLSDGLAGDLRHILQASGNLGALLFEDSLPIHPDVYTFFPTEIAANPAAAIKHALSDGEDFELCLCVAPEALTKLPHDLIAIGLVRDQPGIILQSPGNIQTPWSSAGFDHFS